MLFIPKCAAEMAPLHDFLAERLPLEGDALVLAPTAVDAAARALGGALARTLPLLEAPQWRRMPDQTDAGAAG